MKSLIILRGLPGSGKSTLLTKHLNSHRETRAVCSADYFWGQDYKYDKDLIQHAHQWCRLYAMRNMHIGFTYVYVDNTNIQKKHYKEYVQMAKHFHYEVKFLLPNTDWAWDVEECFKRNTHNVPKDIIQRMKDRFEEDNEFEIIRLPS